MNLKVWQRRLLMVGVTALALLVIGGNIILSSHWINKPFPGFFLYSNLVLSPDFLPGWSGRQTGLRFMDRVVSVDSKQVSRPSEIYELVQSHSPGTRFRYTVERDGSHLTLAIPSMKFSFQDWLLTYGIYLLIGLSFLAIGFTPFYFRTPTASAVPLLFLVSVVFLWFSTTFDFMTSQVLPKEIRAFAFALTPGAGIHLGLSFSTIFSDLRRRRLVLLVIYGISILLGLFYSLSFHGALEVWQTILKLCYSYSFLAALVFVGLLFAELHRPHSDLERSRLRVMLVGAALGFFIPTLGTVLVSSFEWAIPHNVLLVAAVFFPLSVAYALLKYNLFDIDAILKVGVTRGGLTALLLLIYVALVYVLSVSFGVYENAPLVPLLFSLLVALVFNPLLRWIEGVVGRFVFRREYDPAQIQSEISSLLRSLSKPKEVTDKYLNALNRQMGIETTYLFYRAREQESSFVVSHQGNGDSTMKIPDHCLLPWIDYFEVGNRGISKDEVAGDPVFRDNREELLEIFKELKLELLIPMIFEGKLLGMVGLGKKKSGRGYSADDFGLLSNLADQLALSIKNGMFFEESEKAKEEVQSWYHRSEATNRRLLQMAKQKKQFVANICHELRTPVSTILGYTEVLLDPGFSGDHRNILERIVTNGQDLSQLMDGLLDFSRVEAGTMTATPEEINVQELFQALEIMTRRLLRNRPIRFSIQMDSSLEAVRTDGKTLQQILMHLLTNALKFTERGEITMEIRPHPGARDDFVEFCVSDTGIGIGKKDQEIIFDEFRQLDGSSTRQYGGTGLGLSLCKKMAKALGGRIEVQSEPGQGSIFSVILPVGTMAAPATHLGAELGQVSTDTSRDKLNS